MTLSTSSKSLFSLFLIATIALASLTVFGQQTSTLRIGSPATTSTKKVVSPSDIPAKNLRISFVGSSVTWCDGFLQSGLVKETILNTQKQRSNVIGPRDVAISGPHKLLNAADDRKFFDGIAARLTGVNSEIEFTLTGNEISIVQGIDRSNVAAAEIEVYIDGKLHDTFNNFNTAPLGEEQKSFKGDGTTKTFNLGRPFTYQYSISINGADKKGSQNQGGYSGGIIPKTDDYLIVRKYGKDKQGNPEVHHWINFKVAPEHDAAIIAKYKFGEEISYEKTTIGKSANGELESPFGDGDVSFDVTKPTRISSGLDFRETDDRAVKKYSFATSKTRKVKLKIKGNYKGARETPYFIFNFATNRFFHFQNAGIGGWKLEFLNNPKEFHRSYKKVNEFKPDVVMLETTPNDDWAVKGHKLYTSFNGLSLSELQSMRTFPAKNITFNANTSTYNFQKWVGKIKAIHEKGVTISKETPYGKVANPVAGDYVFVGAYFSNNKEYAVRRVSAYNDKTGEITFDKPLVKTDLIYDDLQALVGLEVRVRSFSFFEEQLKTFIAHIKRASPSVKLSIISNPLPVISARELWGYWEMMGKVAADTKVENLRIAPFYDYQFSQDRDISLTFDAASLKTDPISGFQEGDLKINAGRNCSNFEVLVNGKNVYGKDAVVHTGYSYGIDPSLKGVQLNMDNAKDITRTSQAINRIPRLVFFKNAPASGTIVLKYSSRKWSGDGCHVRNNDDGSKIYGDIYYDFLKKI